MDWREEVILPTKAKNSFYAASDSSSWGNRQEQASQWLECFGLFSVAVERLIYFLRLLYQLDPDNAARKNGFLSFAGFPSRSFPQTRSRRSCPSMGTESHRS